MCAVLLFVQVLCRSRFELGGYGLVAQVGERNVRVARQARVGKQQHLAVTAVAFQDVAKLTPVIGVFMVSGLPIADKRPPPQQIPGRNPR